MGSVAERTKTLVDPLRRKCERKCGPDMNKILTREYVYLNKNQALSQPTGHKKKRRRRRRRRRRRIRAVSSEVTG